MLLTTSCSNCSRRDVEFYCEECLRSRTADAISVPLSKNNNDAVLAVLNTCFQNSLFCGMCKELHGKIKATKTHNIKSLCPSIVTCFNCEDSDSKILCFDCIDIASWAKERKERIFDGISLRLFLLLTSINYLFVQLFSQLLFTCYVSKFLLNVHYFQVI